MLDNSDDSNDSNVSKLLRKKAKYLKQPLNGASIEAKILDNKVYQKTLFYPNRNQLIWHEKNILEKKKNVREIFEKVKEQYKAKLAEKLLQHIE